MSSAVLDPTQRLEQLSRSRAYIHLAMAKAASPFGERIVDAFVARVGAQSPWIDAVRKAEVEAISSTTAGPLTSLRLLSDGFMGRQRERTVAGRAPFRQVPMGVSLAIVDSSGDAEWSNLDYPIRVSSMAFRRVELPATSLDLIRVFTKELATSAAPGSIAAIEDDLIESTARAEDAKFLSQEDAISGLRPAGLLNGLTAVGSGSDLEADFAALVAAVRGGEATAPYLVASRYGAAFLAGQRTTDGLSVFPNVRLDDAGHIWGIPMLLSRAAESRLILIDAATVAIADVGVTFARSETGDLQLSDAPVGGPASMVSLFMTNSVAVKVTRWVHWIRGFDDSVAYMDLSVGSPA
jgi:hypothetical protein